MNKMAKVTVVVVLIVAVVVVIAVKQRDNATVQAVDGQNRTLDSTAQSAPPAPEGTRTKALPRLVDLGAGKCIPCKMMAPILEELKNEYADSMKVDVFDIEKNPDMLDKYRVRVIPTQIFFDASGKELFRHEGFYSKQDILAKWKELGVDLTGPTLQLTTPERLSPVKPDDGPEEESTPNPYSASPKPRQVNHLYPGLTTGALTYAVATELPEGVLLKAGELVINENELIDQINETDEQMRPQLKKNAFFVLEQTATLKLILAEAKAEAAKSDKDTSQKDEQAIIQDYLRTLTEKVKVSEAEILDFYNSNKETVGGATLGKVKSQIEQFLLQQKQQELINKHIQTIGKRMQIEISAPWLKVQAALAKDNPVDKARTNGRVSLVDFGSKGCVPCDMMAPILERLKEKYKGKVNVVFVHVGQKPILASRYGVQSIPVQIFFDKAGNEVFRHTGFFPEEEIEKQLSKMAVK